jgi:hypothetical protein
LGDFFTHSSGHSECEPKPSVVLDTMLNRRANVCSCSQWNAVFNCFKALENRYRNYICRNNLALRLRGTSFAICTLKTGLDVTIAMFCDFRQFSAKKKLAIFSTTMIYCFVKSSLSKEAPIFSPFFLAKIL